jgi:hypothetical protein
MDIAKILAELRLERTQVEEAILSLERLAAGQGRRRGRPPTWMVAAKELSIPKRRGRPPGSKRGTIS